MTSTVEIPAQRDDERLDDETVTSSDSLGTEVGNGEVATDESATAEVMSADELEARRAEWAAEYDTIVHCDPAEVVIDDNVRTENADTDDDTVRDMRQWGVDMAVKGYRADDGTVMITRGQRRVLNARKAGCEVPVWMQAPPSADERKATIERIVRQVNENDLRKGLTLGDRFNAFKQLAAFDLTPTGIARKLGRGKGGKEYVENVLQAGASELARAATERYDLTLDQAAVVAEFESRGDLTIAKELIRLAIAEPNNFRVVADVERRKYAEADRVRVLTEQLTQELTAAGVTLLDSSIAADSGPARSLTRLRPTPDSEPGTPLGVEEHRSCPGHAAWLTEDYQDGNTVMVAEYGCSDFHEHDHALSHAPAGHADFTSVPADTDNEQDDATRKAYDEAVAAEAAAERQRRANSIKFTWVRDSNKEWDASGDGRQKWLTEFAKRRTAPKGSQEFLALQKLRGGRDLRRAMERNHGLANTLLKTAESGSRPLAEQISTATASKATLYDVFLTLCAMEEDLHRDAWRTPYSENKEYMTALIKWGYTASPIELRVLEPERVEDVIAAKLGSDNDAVSAEDDSDDTESGDAGSAPDSDEDDPEDEDDLDPTAIELSTDASETGTTTASTEDPKAAENDIVAAAGM